jgi:hypothetical protein
VLRRAISELVRAVEPGYVQSDAQPKEFFVAFFNMGEQKRCVQALGARARGAGSAGLGSRRRCCCSRCFHALL